MLIATKCGSLHLIPLFPQRRADELGIIVWYWIYFPRCWATLRCSRHQGNETVMWISEWVFFSFSKLFAGLHSWIETLSVLWHFYAFCFKPFFSKGMDFTLQQKQKCHLNWALHINLTVKAYHKMYMLDPDQVKILQRTPGHDGHNNCGATMLLMWLLPCVGDLSVCARFPWILLPPTLAFFLTHVYSIYMCPNTGNKENVALRKRKISDDFGGEGQLVTEESIGMSSERASKIQAWLQSINCF